LSKSSSIKTDNKKVEDVLVLQGGGSLGAFGCGVFKALKKNNINLDVIAGTSIGGINAAIKRLQLRMENQRLIKN
jgi:NTE family protein